MEKKTLARESRPKIKLQKNLALKFYAKTCKKSLKESLDKTTVRIENNIESQEVVISLPKANSKIHKLKSYDKAINNLINGHCWKKAIKKKFQNLESHQTWKYNVFSPKQKAIRL